jgi:hypothetical protein
VLQPVVEYLQQLGEEILFHIREESDNLVNSEKGFTSYSKFSSNEAANNDPEIEFLLSLKSPDNMEIDISSYVIGKTF